MKSPGMGCNEIGGPVGVPASAKDSAVVVPGSVMEPVVALDAVAFLLFVKAPLLPLGPADRLEDLVVGLDAAGKIVVKSVSVTYATPD